MSWTTLARSADILWKLLESYGIEPDPLFRELHIDPQLIQDPNARYRLFVVDELWEKAAQVIDDPCFALKAADYWHPSHLHALGYAWLASATLRTALQRLSRYIRVVSDLTELGFTENADEFSVVLRYDGDAEKQPWHADSSLSIITAMCRANYGDGLDPVAVYFKHARPPCAGDYFAYFRCPVHFDATHNQLTLPLDVMDKRLASDNPQLAQLNDEIMIRYLAKLDAGNIINRVKAAIIDRMPSGDVTDQAIAGVLHMNVRALQRKLQHEDTTFKTLLDSIREELAYQYIRDSRLNLNEISFLLGFAEVSSFSRAFKRWTGERPSAYRQLDREPVRG